ncbi:hypothetical protein NE237_024620 [Protea cynaroides]|uniref:Uncharacterized protein n=1 Tax=Protea cynaroides TaxID=273540 RepID=A0A9Q0H1J4_9MAGN|nr:hypothetical protein NE237_024620 [Protea cynaroides]
MVMDAFIPSLRRRYLAMKYFSALLLVMRLILFTLGDAHTSSNFSVIGVIIVTGALIMDSFLVLKANATFTDKNAIVKLSYVQPAVYRGISHKFWTWFQGFTKSLFASPTFQQLCTIQWSPSSTPF